MSDLDLLTAREAARLLGIPVFRLAIYRRNGMIGCYRYSRKKILFDRAELMEFRARARLEPKEAPRCG